MKRTMVVVVMALMAVVISLGTLVGILRWREYCNDLHAENTIEMEREENPETLGYIEGKPSEEEDLVDVDLPGVNENSEEKESQESDVQQVATDPSSEEITEGLDGTQIECATDDTEASEDLSNVDTVGSSTSETKETEIPTNSPQNNNEGVPGADEEM